MNYIFFINLYNLFLHRTYRELGIYPGYIDIEFWHDI